MLAEFSLLVERTYPDQQSRPYLLISKTDNLSLLNNSTAIYDYRYFCDQYFFCFVTPKNRKNSSRRSKVFGCIEQPLEVLET